jgi:hypothetical protein
MVFWNQGVEEIAIPVVQQPGFLVLVLIADHFQ